MHTHIHQKQHLNALFEVTGAIISTQKLLSDIYYGQSLLLNIYGLEMENIRMNYSVGLELLGCTHKEDYKHSQDFPPAGVI